MTDGSLEVAGPLVEWRWYCRICGAGEVVLSQTEQSDQAYDHITAEHHYGHGRDNLGWAEAGHLVHIWCY